MNNLQQFKDYIKQKTVAVLGIGISNLPLISFLAKNGAAVTACDKKSRAGLGEKTADELERMGVSLCLGEAYLENLSQDVIFKTPGMRFDLPPLVAARERGSVVTSEMEVFFALCPAPILAVTGSDGKTTTTTLIYEILKQQGYRCHLGGNIGKPLLCEVDKIRPEDKVVVELSSFQLHTMRQSPHVAVVTNLSPNHLDMHKSMEEYVDAKKNIYRFQNTGDRLVLNADNAITSQMAAEAKTGDVALFSRSPRPDGVCVRGDSIFRNGEFVLKLSDIKIPGWHNVENYMAAIAAVGDMASYDAVRSVAKTFGGVAHRIEFVAEKGGVKFYNSSIDSSPNRTKNTLSVFSQKVVLICGGKDKGIPYDEIGPVIAEKVKAMVLIGATADKIESAAKAAGAKVPTVRAATYPEAVAAAKAAAKPGDIVVLSPASTSFDMFRNFEERGNLFKELVQKL